jgi:UDP-4-amino-4-deoxy-L-arabinose formyltransferase/UDP-glucuronic acid dehydrogenase (UDP-4-keto-hexauronic acid decarboxylating)
MRIAIIGRSELLFETAQLLIKKGFEIPLVITSKAAPEYKIKEEDYKFFAKTNNSVFIQTGRINTEEVIKKISSLKTIDIAVSINYSGVIADEIIDLFPMGILNAHGGDLPRYRGNACQAWAIINGEKEIGLCVHKMIGGELDSGDIISKSFLPININTRVGEAYDWMEKEIPVLMLNAIDKLSKNINDVQFQSKDPKDALRTYPRNPDDGEIDWNKDAETIIRLINASSEPFSGAFTTYNGEKLIIWRASLYIDNENYCAIPGQIAKINKDSGSIIVITGKGKVEIKEIEINGVRTEPANIIKSIRKRLK